MIIIIIIFIEFWETQTKKVVTKGKESEWMMTTLYQVPGAICTE